MANFKELFYSCIINHRIEMINIWIYQSNCDLQNGYQHYTNFKQLENS